MRDNQQTWISRALIHPVFQQDQKHLESCWLIQLPSFLRSKCLSHVRKKLECVSSTKKLPVFLKCVSPTQRKTGGWCCRSVKCKVSIFGLAGFHQVSDFSDTPRLRVCSGESDARCSFTDASRHASDCASPRSTMGSNEQTRAILPCSFLCLGFHYTHTGTDR